MHKKTIILFAAFLATGTTLHAQQTDTTSFSPDRSDTLQATVFTASRRGNFLSKGKELRTEVISQSGLQKMACCNLAESFENSASVTVGYSDAVTGARQLRLLGLSGIYTQMLDESRPIMRGISAPFGLSYIPGPWLESIQIAKGSPSVIGGSESMTGQVNVEHRKPTDEIPLFLNASVMSDTKTDLNATSSIQLSPALSTILMAHANGNFKPYDMNMDGFMDDPKTRQFNVASRWFYYTPSLQVRWGVSAVSDKRKGGREEYDRKTYSFGSPWGTDIRNNMFDAYLKIGKPLREDQCSSLALVADWSYDKMDAWFGGASYLGRQHSGFANLLYRNQFNESHDLTVGAGATLDRYDETLLRILPGGADNSFPRQRSDLAHGGAYGEYTFHHGEVLSAIVGVRGEWYKGDGFRLSPRITLKYQPSERLIFRANGGRGLRNALPLTDHIGVLSTGKTFTGDWQSHMLEDSWIFGGNATWYLPFMAAYISLDAFGTRFTKQLIVDYEDASGQIAFYPLNGRSYTGSYQADVHLEPFTRFSIDMTARYTDAKTEYRSIGLSETPLSSRFKGVLNIQYKTNLSRWIFDFTASVNGSARVYGFMKDLRDDDGKLIYPHGRTPIYPLLFAQITRRLRGVDIYVGGENLTNFRQKEVILGGKTADGMVDTSSPSFDASAIWGPLMGIRINAGIRLTIWK